MDEWMDGWLGDLMVTWLVRLVRLFGDAVTVGWRWVARGRDMVGLAIRGDARTKRPAHRRDYDIDRDVFCPNCGRAGAYQLNPS
jgi:hypothetical protein